MRRRAFLSALGGAGVATLLPARAQQPNRPVIGFLRSTPSAPFAHLVEAFRRGLTEEGFTEGRNIGIEYRWANNDPARLPALAADLVERHVAAIVGNNAAVEAARALTNTIPIVFVAGDDPVRAGLVSNLSRPGGNLTGVTFFGGGQLNVKRLELLNALAPTASSVGVLLDPSYPGSDGELGNVLSAAQAAGRRIVAVTASAYPEIDAAFSTLVQARAGALLVSGSPIFTSHHRALVALASAHGLPAIYDLRDYAVAGGLASYGASLPDSYRQAGVYVGRILKGAKPSELPVLQPTKFELVINVAAAKELGLSIPPSLLAWAEVIE